MVGTAQPAPDDRLTCEKCHGFYAVEVPEDGGTPRVRCNACGHVRELSSTPVPKPEEKGKWTVIGPDGKVMTFGSWEKLVGSAPPPPVEPKRADAGAAAPAQERKVSAASLLGGSTPPAPPRISTPPLPPSPKATSTPPVAAPKLMLEDLESNPILPVRPSLKPASAPVWAPGKKETPAPAKAVIPVAPESEDEPAPLSLRDADAIDDDSEPSPLSLRDVIPADNETSPLSLNDVTTDADASDQHEVVSLDEVVLTDSSPDVTKNRAPPARGALSTLPPTRPKGDVAPPPTITVDEREPDSQAITAKVTPRVVSSSPPKKPPVEAKRSLPPKPEKASESKALEKKPVDQRTPPEKKAPEKKAPEKKPVDERTPVTARSATPAEEPAKRGWLVPSITVAAGALVVWRLMAASPKPETPPPTPVVTATAQEPAATATATATATAVETAATQAAATSEAPPPVSTPTSAPPAETATNTTAAVAATTPRPTTKAPTTAAADGDTAAAAEKPEKKPAAAETGLSMSDLLDRAGSAKRSGDFGTARELYEKVVKQSPGNVEANGGLGDVARAQGDVSGAKTSYGRALAASPTYVPALLGLADIEWDSGDRASAQRRYAQIVEQLGRRSPERARQRSAPGE